jgi:hypothetical protein
MPGRLPDPGPRARAAMASARADAEVPATDQHPSGPYEDWTVDELQRRASQLGIEGRSAMRKDELIAALRTS